jgi:hypothetical protein
MKKYEIGAFKVIEVTKEEYVSRKKERLMYQDELKAKEMKRNLKVLAKINKTKKEIENDIKEAENR